MQVDKNNLMTLGDKLNEAVVAFYNPAQPCGHEQPATVLPAEVCCVAASLFTAHLAMLTPNEQAIILQIMHELVLAVVNATPPDPRQHALDLAIEPTRETASGPRGPYRRRDR